MAAISSQDEDGSSTVRKRRGSISSRMSLKSLDNSNKTTEEGEEIIVHTLKRENHIIHCMGGVYTCALHTTTYSHIHSVGSYELSNNTGLNNTVPADSVSTVSFPVVCVHAVHYTCI